ncbi:MAG: iron-sulfur cluster assembly accessory protein [Actinobacteria bacterium]|nr:MAG: iron-sulfur cluster assembly accessory protein [Actinomycetota bacterium]
MIQLTQTAAGKVKELLEEEGRADISLRVAVQPGGCSGLRYAMYLDDQLSDKVEASGFTIDNPAAQGSCACGHSFH